MNDILFRFLMGLFFISLGALNFLYMKQQESLEDRIKKLEDKK